MFALSVGRCRLAWSCCLRGWAMGLLMWMCVGASGQQLLEVINQTEKAVVAARAYVLGGQLVDEGAGFFISADGLALLPASLFYYGDSVTVELRSGRTYVVNRILQAHAFANMAMVRVANPRNHTFTYLLPSREMFVENQDVLVYSHPLELDGGFDAVQLGRVSHQFYLKRQARVRSGISERSFGAPVVNVRGQCVGVVNAWDDTRPSLVQNILFMNDSLWFTVNKATRQMRQSQALRDRLSPDLNAAMYYLSLVDYPESARYFSRHLKLFPRDGVAYALRGHVRFMYKNNFGSREDFTLLSQLNPNDYLLYYLEGVHLMREKKYAEAQSSFTRSLAVKSDFAYALVERGRARVLLKGDKQAAFDDFTAAIRVDTTYADGYYERARLVLQHAENNQTALGDLSRAILLDPNLPGACTIRGTIYLALNDYRAATRDFDVALVKDPLDRYAYFNRGVAFYNMGMSERACVDWQRAVELGYSKAADYVAAYCSAKVRKQGR
ncbi:Tetratricopeptide repeat-containing protein [Breznakibacter xylanolyticus]|uniref:Tetratricopeptide repeat-containing protein n=1 Tax=Breznakibacter xylanolyticus TaxID=990 RepID=A0A2W7NBC1_9BACT|nr:tetratricopeptide repeat-containing serine protease family protein [Breznakibacter xylanolyticus]PZX17428.1 Tetratricopeptide repeat-containing protein [Breznakibacter xylanolyticus]